MFASQLLRRPIRAELLATAVLAAAAVLPLHALVATNEFAVAIAACAAPGLAGLLVLAARSIALRGRERDNVLDVLLPALILPSFVVLAHPMVFLTSALWPTTFDHRLYLADTAFGAPLSFVVGRAIAAAPLLPAICMAVYVGLPAALMLVHTLRAKREVRSGDALVAFVAVTVVGYFGYLAAPVAGPVYAFGDLFPLHPPDPSTLSSAKSLVQPMPRNCMPSLHSAWALLVWWNARPLSRGLRAAAAVFLAITLLATVGLGFHYVVDLVAAFPLTMAAQSWATRVTNANLRRFAIGAGLATTAAWMALVTGSDAMLQWPAPACWALASGVIALSCRLESLVYATRCDDLPSDLVAKPAASWIDRGAALSLVLVGLAGFLHWAIVANALALVFGATQQVRTVLVAVGLVACTAGVVVGGIGAATMVQPLRAAALAAAGFASACWLSPLLLPWIHNSFLAAAGPLSAQSTQSTAALIALTMPLLLAGAMLAGLTTAFLTQHFGAGHRNRTRTMALGFGLPLVGAGLGSLATGYLILPSLRSSAAPAIVGIGVALLAAGLSFRVRSAADPESGEFLAGGPRASIRLTLNDERSENSFASRIGSLGTSAHVAMIAITAGLLTTTLTHLFAVIAGDTVYSRAQAPFLLCLGLGSGALLASRAGGDQSQRRFGLVLALGGLAATVAIGLSLWSGVPDYFGSFRAYAEQHKVTTTFAEREFVRLCAGALLLMAPMLAVGAALSLGAGLLGKEREGNRASSLAFLVAVAVPAFLVGLLAASFWLLSTFGSRVVLEISAWLALLTGAAAVRELAMPARKAGAATLATAAALLLVFPSPFDVGRLASGSGLSFQPEPEAAAIDSADSIEGMVGVLETPRHDVRRIAINALTTAQRRIGEEAAAPAPRELAGLLFSHGRDRALVIGLGSGVPVRILRDAGLREVIVAEPNNAVVAMVRSGFDAFHDGALDDQRTRIVPIDGRSALARSRSPFDLIVVNAFAITSADAAPLYTREFYQAAATRLAPGGVLQQDLALNRMSATAITSVVAAARRTFDKVRIFFLGQRATLVACSGDCDRGIDSEQGAADADALTGIGAAYGVETTPLDEGGWLDPAATDRMLESTAEQLGVAVDALGSKDLDMFLPYHAPRSLLGPYDAPSAGLALLRDFATKPATKPTPAPAIAAQAAR